VHPNVLVVQAASGLLMSAEPESFLTRWSRRKRAAEREAERPAEGAAPQVPAAPPAKAGGEEVPGVGSVSAAVPLRDTAAMTEVSLPPIESLDGLRSDYQAFFQQSVDDDVRRAALKKLFADPHFNQMDMLDVYVDDYTQFEPLPAALRMRLPSARDFLLDSERKALEAAEASTGAAGDAPGAEIAAAGGEIDPASRPDAGGDVRGLAVEDSGVASTSAPAAAPNATPADAPSLDDPAHRADVSSSPAIPLGKATAPDSSST
jgi:Protein of unknown function (DUF3306)